MPPRFRSYTAYSVGCAVVWAAILAIIAITGSKDALHKLLLVFGGWAVGWTSATIARSVYPPPRQRRASQ